jgi:hypothetical protein
VQVNSERVARSPIIPVGQCLSKIREMWMYFGKVGSSTPDDTEVTVEDRAAFYGTLFASTGIAPSKEEYKLLELRALFQIFLRLACLERDVVFNAVLRMCTDYDRGITVQSPDQD